MPAATLVSRCSLTSIIRSEFSHQNQYHLSKRNPLTRNQIFRIQPRHASTSSSNSSSKPIVLEQPDKFRPPSHPQKLVRSRSRSNLNLGGAYNQSSTQSEKDSQRHKRYPHMFPDEGTFMHWFLTNKSIHLWIAMGTLTILATISMTQTFLHTSPYSHLFPSISSLPSHPLTYFSEVFSVLRLHMEYTTEKTAESRKQKILDAQKRRLYRRAHGMENLDAEEEQGIDVRGLVSWDDGLTNKERREGGREERVITGRMVVEAGGKVGDDIEEFARNRRKLREGNTGVEDVTGSVGGNDDKESTLQEQIPEQSGQEIQKRKRKLWFGIW